MLASRSGQFYVPISEQRIAKRINIMTNIQEIKLNLIIINFRYLFKTI